MISSGVQKEWIDLLDETTERFWREGNHRVDDGLLILLRNPSLENARNYLLRMDKKRNRLHEVYSFVEKANKQLLQEGKISDDYNFKEILGI